MKKIVVSLSLLVITIIAPLYVHADAAAPSILQGEEVGEYIETIIAIGLIAVGILIIIGLSRGMINKKENKTQQEDKKVEVTENSVEKNSDLGKEKK